jgi:hypothetical protein
VRQEQSRGLLSIPGNLQGMQVCALCSTAASLHAPKSCQQSVAGLEQPLADALEQLDRPVDGPQVVHRCRQSSSRGRPEVVAVVGLR